jgi:hypothetical protein
VSDQKKGLSARRLIANERTDRCWECFLIWAVCFVNPSCSQRTDVAVATNIPSFITDVRPILATRCFSCHGEGDDLQGGLDLRELSRILAGGVSGPAVVPGNLNGSLLFEMVALDEMPPEDEKLTNAEKEVLARWLEGGARQNGK